MFTGLVEGRSEILAVDWTSNAPCFLMRPVFEMPVEAGRVVTHNGVALVVEPCGQGRYFARGPQALARTTTISGWKSGWYLSVERSATLQSVLDGHILRGQVDAVATVEQIWDADGGRFYRLSVPGDDLPLLVWRGTIAVDGVGLNVAALGDATFDIWLGSRTLELTNLGRVCEKDKVNLEYDVFAKYVARRLECGGEGASHPARHTSRQRDAG